MKTYRTRISLILVFLILAVTFLPVCFINREGVAPLLACNVIIDAFIFLCFFGIKYVIDGDVLKVYSFWGIHHDIKISSITKIEKSRCIISSPAASLDRLAIHYNKYDTIYISPRRQEEFLAELHVPFVLTHADRQLLSLLTTSQPSQSTLDTFLASWDIEAQGANRGLLLANWYSQHSDLHLTPYVAPRLDGLIRYFRFQNLPLLAHLKQFTTSLTHHNIPYALIGDGALRTILPPQPRDTDHFHILIDKKNIKQAQSIADEQDIHDINITHTFWGKHATAIADCITQAQVPSATTGAITTATTTDLLWLLLLNIAYAHDSNQPFHIPTMLIDINHLATHPTFSAQQLRRRIDTSATAKAIRTVTKTYAPYLPPNLSEQ